MDGSGHLEQAEYDHRRDQDLELLGLRVMRFSNLDVNKNLERVLEEILLACRLAVMEKPDPAK